MSSGITMLSVVGARPQFVKLAPIVRAIEEMPKIQHQIVHTGQHYDDNMSAVFFEQLELPKPDLDLGVGSGSHGEQTAAMLTRLEKHFAAVVPDVVLTYGDTNSTLAATLAASKIHVPVAHVEAGLRSFNRLMPEEVNRLVADHCGDRLYAPTPQAMQHLSSENLSERAILSGDVMLDAILHNIQLAKAKSNALDRLNLSPKKFGLVTVHRPVNTEGVALTKLLQALECTSREYLPLVFPVHPRTRAMLDAMSYVPPSGLTLLDPLPYLDCILLIHSALIVVTDSGGIQKEAAFLHTPCLTMRDETEWTETVGMGVNRLVGDAGEGLVSAVGNVLCTRDVFSNSVLDSIQYHFGAGDASKLIVSDCANWLAGRETDVKRTKLV